MFSSPHTIFFYFFFLFLGANIFTNLLYMWVSLIQHGIIIWNILYSQYYYKLYLYISQNHKRKNQKKKEKLKYITSFPTFWSFTFDLTEQFSFHFSFLCIVGENENRFFFVFFFFSYSRNDVCIMGCTAV